MKMFHVDSQGHVDIINIGPFDGSQIRGDAGRPTGGVLTPTSVIILALPLANARHDLA